MNQDILYDKNQKLQTKPLNGYPDSYPEKGISVDTLKKQLAQLLQQNKQKQQYYLTLQTQLKQSQLQQHKLQSTILKSQLEFETIKLEILQQKHYHQEQKQKHLAEEQKQMEMHEWLDNVQKFNGLEQEKIEQLVAMEYQGSPLDAEICLACYKEMETGVLSKYLPCCHLFHGKCIDEHLKVSKVCPACMEEVIL